MYSRTIRLFVSSTFLDMQEERNILHLKVFPRIRQYCEDRGLSFFPVELRWGITEEEQFQGKVLSLCLSEIDNCRPFFIGLVGNRYGSII